MDRHRACGLQVIVVVSFVCAVACPAGAQVGTWDFAGVARAVATYEGRTLRLDYPFEGVIVLDADGTYRSAGLGITCQPVETETPPVAGRWRVGANGVLRGPLNARALRAALRTCFGRSATLAGWSGQVQLLDGDHQAGRFRLSVRLRYREADEIEVVPARVRGTLAGTRRPD